MIHTKLIGNRLVFFVDQTYSRHIHAGHSKVWCVRDYLLLRGGRSLPSTTHAGCSTTALHRVHRTGTWKPAVPHFFVGVIFPSSISARLQQVCMMYVTLPVRVTM